MIILFKIIMKNDRFKSFSISIVILLCLIASGCATKSRYIKHPTAPPPDAGVKAKKSGIEVILHYVITPNGQGSWVKDAPWVEYVVTIKNYSNKSVSVTNYSLIDVRGVHIPSGADTDKLETESQYLVKIYKDMGISGAIILTPSVLAASPN